VPNLLSRPRLRGTRPGTLDAALGPEENAPEVIASGDVRWLNLERPREADRDWLEQEFGFHPLAIEDVASRNQRPKLDAYDDYLFIVLHFPVFDKAQDRLLTAELDLFVGPDYLITLPDQNLPPLSAMFERYRARDEVRDNVLGKGTGYLLYKIVDTCVDASFPMLRRIGDKLDRLEDDIFEGRSAEIVRELSNAKQEIINFRRVVRPMRAVLRDLERTKQRYLTDELDVYFDDITDAAERIWDVLENYKEVAEALEDSNESVLSHRLNESLRVLTAFSVTLLPLTLLTGLFGMNVPLPGQPGSSVEFFLIVAVMAALLAGVLYFFRRRGYL
jgi:magnesium transporter